MSQLRSLPNLTRKLISAAEQHKAKLGEVGETLSRELALSDAVLNLNFTDGPTVSQAIIEAVEAKKDPVTDKGVQTALTRSMLIDRHQFGSLNELVNQRLFNKIASNRNEIVAAFKPAFNAAGQALAEAHATLTNAGIMSLADPGITSGNMIIVSANFHARTATDTMTTIYGIINPILYVIGAQNGAAGARTLSTIEVSEHTTQYELRRIEGGGRLEPWDALTAGFTINLATPDEVEQRVTQLTEATDAAERTAEANRREYTRIHH